MSEPEAVLDASALLAYLQAEPGAEIVQEALAKGCAMSAVNWAEVLSKVADLGMPSHELIADLEHRQLLGASLRIAPFDRHDAPLVGDMRPPTRDLGLSLGDRACLALGRRRSAPILTTDHAWGKIDGSLEVDIRVIR